MSETASVGTTRFGKRQVLFDPRLVAEPDEQLFVPAAGDRIDVGGGDIGRARVVVHDYHGLEVVSKHYHRGGMMSWLLEDVYFGVRAERSRSFREWCMLSIMCQQGLPVPAPVAASVISSGMFYRADLVTRRIPAVATLSDLCTSGDIDTVTWRNVGRVLKAFHDSNVYHADLNARNILVAADGMVHLVDFDKGGFRPQDTGWRRTNLDRLRRSLDKFAGNTPGFRFSDADWRVMLEGYNQD